MNYVETGNLTVKLYETYRVVGLDLFIHNKGASSLTVAIDSNMMTRGEQRIKTITVLAGDSFFMNSVKFAEVAVTSSVAYDMVLAGVGI